MKNLRENYEKNIIKQCFLDKTIFLTCVEKVPSEKLFQNTLLRLFWQVFLMIYEEGQELHSSVVKDVLTETNNEELIDKFKEIASESYDVMKSEKILEIYLLRNYLDQLMDI